MPPIKCIILIANPCPAYCIGFESLPNNVLIVERGTPYGQVIWFSLPALFAILFQHITS